MQADVKIFIVSPRSATKKRTQKNIVKKVIKEIKNISLQKYSLKKKKLRNIGTNKT